jgi:hypothetical protein
MRSQLSQVEGLLAAKHEEVQELGGTLNATIARCGGCAWRLCSQVGLAGHKLGPTLPAFCRLEASELVRQEAEREKDALVAANEHLQRELDEMHHRAGAQCLELQSVVATLQQKLSAEEQHNCMLQVGGVPLRTWVVCPLTQLGAAGLGGHALGSIVPFLLVLLPWP